MNDTPIHLGATSLKSSTADVRGEYVLLGSERFYRIANYDRMNPFFMSIVSASNHWLFISSLGGLTAGRQNSNNALFPYYTEDKIHDGSGHTGSRTIVRVTRNGKRFLWEPFNTSFGGGGAFYSVSRNLYKNVPGNKIVFEEENHDLGLVFRYTWTFSDRFGFVKHSEVVNSDGESVRVDVLDGIENLLPWGVAEAFQSAYSCLGDAYKQNELDESSCLATYAFSSQPGDSPEPSEALRATVCWSTSSMGATRLLSSLQLDEFRRGGDVQPEAKVCGRRGAFFVRETRELTPGEAREWLIVADLDYGLPEIASLKKAFATAADSNGPGLKSLILEDVDEGTRRLKEIVAQADGLQTTGDTLGSAHHFANVLFNVMRGGIFESGYAIPVADLASFVQAFNRKTFTRREDFLSGLGKEIELDRLLDDVRSLDDPEFLRLVVEYLPISFSRRHGDPSRPWNKFSINVKNRDGSKILDYQGNWRDIFQNWEALCLSFPEYLEGVIGKFVNTTTADGYNPYRVTKEGYDWEAPDPNDPWAHFGYWGDHQLIYLLKFLEASRNHYPAALEELLHESRFVYADVPYDIKPYADLLEDPRKSIEYNTDREARIAARVEALGFDGRYLADASGEIIRANLAEKLLVPLLAKVSNFVPGAGFWMNTQRPEWNDANNALAGYGASMVTLYYARRYVSFLIELLTESDHGDVELSTEVSAWLAATAEALSENRQLLEESEVGDSQRKAILDGLGRAADKYRSGLYANGLSARQTTLPITEIVSFLNLARACFDHTIGLNRRDDGLYHAYNVLVISPDRIAVERLQAMLEGQVAVLSSGALSPEESLSVLEALRNSSMYRADQHSYLLYPAKELPGFMDKNTIPTEQADRSKLLTRLVADGNTDLVESDVDGDLHFNGLFRNIRDIRAALETLGQQGYSDLVDEESGLIAEIFESIFDHKTFTGRSGTFYGYEGLGCIYWHMVSKLLLATQETALTATSSNETFNDLTEAYYDVRAGIGFNKAPDVYGAFPTDPYSHTPGYAGAKQPGMTGQVKEEIITRFGELGVSVNSGRVSFSPSLLRASEFLSDGASFNYYDVDGESRTLDLEPGTLAFTYCQVPIIYRRSQDERLELHRADGTAVEIEGLVLDEDSSAGIFNRSGAISRIEVFLQPGLART